MFDAAAAERGENVGAEDKQSRIAFLFAKEYGYDEIMKLLSEHGTDLEYDYRTMSPFTCLVYIYLCDETSFLSSIFEILTK